MAKYVNKVIRFLMAGDFFLNSAWGLLGPVFAIFILQNIATESAGKAAEVAGFAALTYWITKSFLQIPIGHYLDKTHGEKDDFLFMVLGLFLTALTPFGFLASSQPWHIYAFQVLHAFGMAMFVPSWNAVFTRHIDRGKEAFEWGLNSTFVGFGVGITGAIGGILAAYFGFKIIFILAGSINIISAFILLFVRKQIIPRDHIAPQIPPSRPF